MIFDNINKIKESKISIKNIIFKNLFCIPIVIIYFIIKFFKDYIIYCFKILYLLNEFL